MSTTLAAPARELTSADALKRNLRLAVSRISAKHAEQTTGMLLENFPRLDNDFERLRSLAQAYIRSSLQPLRPVQAPSELDPETLSQDLSLRFVDGYFYLGAHEGVVFQGRTAVGPYPIEVAKRLTLERSAASPTNDSRGHILDPEMAATIPACTISPEF